MEQIRFKFSMELTRRQSKRRRRYRRISCKTLGASMKISRKAISENKSHMNKRSVGDFKM
jgi:hypothetical protein